MRSNKIEKIQLVVLVLLAMGWAAGGRSAWADQNYSQQVFFENSLSPGNYFYSSGRASAPSTLRLMDGKLPIETSTFVSAPNALKLQWESMPTGGWSVEVRLYEWRNRTVNFPGSDLWIWVCAPQGMQAKALPRLALRDADRNFTEPLDMGGFARDLAPGKWTRVRIPLAAFRSASVHAFSPHQLNTLVFVQGEADSTQHALLLDDIRIENEPAARPAAPPTPQDVHAKGYERHFDITWKPVDDADLAQYVVYRSSRRRGL